MSAERLGRTPEGLEWLTKNNQPTNKTTPDIAVTKDTIKQEQKQVIQSSAIAQATQDLSSQYDDLLKQARIVELNLLEERLKNPEKDAVKLRKKNTKSTQVGLSEGWTRATFIIREEHVNELKRLASQHQTSIKDLIELAMMQFLSRK
jgi:hypothetical protein